MSPDSMIDSIIHLYCLQAHKGPEKKAGRAYTTKKIKAALKLARKILLGIKC